MIKDIIEKDYPELPLGSMCAIVIALIYFVSPRDIIPDNIPGVGYIDDAAVLLISLTLVKRDIDEYVKWREEKQQRSSSAEKTEWAPHSASN